MRAEPPGGSSVFWTLADSRIQSARERVARGLLADAQALLGEAASADSPLGRQACREGREILRRIRRDYSLGAAELLDRVRRVLPDATAEEIERWRRSGGVQYRVLDGQVCFFQREPANLWKRCEEAKGRRAVAEGRDPAAPAPVPEPQRELLEHLARVVASAGRSGSVQVEPVRHRIRYRLTVAPDRPGARAGSVVRCWLPYPQEYRQQRDVRLIRTDPEGGQAAPSALGDWPMSGAPQRTVYLERVLADAAEAMVFSVEYEYVSCAYYPVLDDAAARADLPAPVNVYLRERPPHIRFTPSIRSVVEEIVAGESNPLARVRRIFHWFDREIRYAFEEEYSTIPSLSERALALRRGDCGVQVMLFVAMCRLAGVPARWQSGWATFPGHWNMHDWAEVYVAPWGWLPVDVSYGLKVSDDPAVREFYFGHQDSYRLIVNLDYGCGLYPPKADFRSEPVDFQRGEVEMDGRNLYYDEWDYEFGFDVEPA